MNSRSKLVSDSELVLHSPCEGGWLEMAKRKSQRIDVRELPAYSIAEAAHYLIMPEATVRYWAKGQNQYPSLIDVPKGSPTLLTFINLVELHVLVAIRREHAVPMPKVRAAIDYLKEHAQSKYDRKHPLISKRFETDGLDLFIQWYGDLVNISQAGQLAMSEVMSAALHRIQRDAAGIPIKLYPFTRSSISNAPTFIVIDPLLSAGRPVITGTGLATAIIADRYKAGDSIDTLAHDYERKEAEIEEAIRCELQAAA